MNSAQQRNVRELNSHYIEQHDKKIEQKSISNKGLVRRLSALGLFVATVMVATVITLQSQHTVLSQKIEKKQYLENELVQLQLVERDLIDEIENLNSLEYIAEIARRDYFLTKPGEIIFKLPTITSD
ncbi:hypothetical protein BKP45_08880 [Anaerobacillus alkalidiazotrophicus]|uniref:Cell division protein n=1 Tax=Anaerobacillus alkalidiazotrophicus TaxID=472963 RepID=A0A1S2M6U0_9BACI|nr:septum formation initiator family protein [Anaerobacillus alkalidiazotrophicus]OIJ20512.1 hypothetical protein BKP45_08880 [Anaerobacillus alkalidiazotrophicus]